MEIILSKEAPEPIGPYSQAIKTDNFIFISGQLGIDPKTGKLVSDNIEDQTKQALKNIENILKEAKCPLNNVIDVTIFLTDLNNFKVVNEIYSSFFKSHKPTRTTVQVAALPLNAKIEIKTVATV